MSGETEAAPSGWTTDTVLAFMQQQHNDLETALQNQISAMHRALDERYETQTKALDAALIAQQTAMRTAFDAADKAVQAALESAKEATNKAELAADKRFESVNEFRAQLTDQARTFMPRTEAEARLVAVSEKLEDQQTRASQAHDDLSVRISDTASRIENFRGNASGALAQHTESRLNYGLLIAAATLLLGLIGTVITLIVVSHA